jgi:glycosidase
MVRFLDNHDGKRFLTVAAESQPDVGKRHGRLKLALTYMLTSGGVPIIYYGTEQGFEGGTGDWSSSREDMFDGEFEFGPSEGDNFDSQNELFRFTQKLLRTRAGYKALRLGDMKWLATSSDEPGVLAYLRSEGHSGVLIVINTSEVKSVEFSSPELFGSTDGASDGAALRPADGWLTQWPDRSKPLRLSPQEIAIFEVQLRIPEIPPKDSQLTKIPKSVAGFSIISRP